MPGTWIPQKLPDGSAIEREVRAGLAEETLVSANSAKVLRERLRRRLTKDQAQISALIDGSLKNDKTGKPLKTSRSVFFMLNS
jgi:hypothetical protein